MAKNLFSVPIFFIAFRECLEASLIIAILLGLVEQIVHQQTGSSTATSVTDIDDKDKGPPTGIVDDKASSTGEDKPPNADILENDGPLNGRALIRKLRIQIFLGASIGLVIALAIGAAFIAVWFTQASNLWAKSEVIWEGVFSLIASIIILVMGLTMLKLDQAKTKWRVKLQHAFSKNAAARDVGAKTGRYALFILPFITVLREGIEAVIFIGGVALGQPAASIPIAAIVGIICGLVVGVLIYFFSSKSSLRVFLIIMTSFLMLIGAGLFSKAVWLLEENAFQKLLGQDVDDAAGAGPGTFRVSNSVWHIDCCNPKDTTNTQGWSIFAAIFGWTNSATYGSVISYILYWIVVMACLVTMKWKEGRTRIGKWESKRGRERRERVQRNLSKEERTCEPSPKE